MPSLNKKPLKKKTKPVSEVLDTNRSIKFSAYTDWGSVSIDPGRTDYAFYSRLYSGVANGYSYVWPLPKSVTSKKRAIVTNITPRVECDDQYTSERLSEWLKLNADKIGHLSEFAGRLGDMYAHISPPGYKEEYPNIHPIQPDVVHPLTNKNDFSKIDGWQVHITYRSHTGFDQQTITDEFLSRVRYRKYSTKKYRERYPYATQQMPFVHIAANRDSNSLFGRSDAEPMLALLRQKQETYTNTFVGHRNMAIPTPVFRKMGTAEEIDNFLTRFGTTRSVQLKDGSSVEYQEYDWHAGQITILAGDAEMDMVSPSPFVEETQRVIDLTHRELIIATEIPEFAFGISVSSSDRTASEQMRAFVLWGEKQRLEAKSWISRIVRIVMEYMAIYDSGIKLQSFDLVWPPLIPDNGKIRLQQLGMLLRYGILDGVTALKVARELDPSISDPEEIFKKAQSEIVTKPNPNLEGNGRSGDTASELPTIENKISEGMYDGIDFSITKDMSNNAKRAIERNKELPRSKRGMTSTGMRRARQLAKGGTLSPNDVITMRAWFARHTSTSKNSPNFKDRERAWVAWMGWGGDAAKSRVNSIYRQMMSKNPQLKEAFLIAYGEMKDEIKL